jgi:hypothetical protein
VPRSQRCGFPTAVFSISRPGPLHFLPSSSSIVLARLSGPRSRPATSQKIWKCRNRTRTSGSVARKSDHSTTEAIPRHTDTLKNKSRLMRSPYCLSLYTFNFCQETYEIALLSESPLIIFSSFMRPMSYERK